MSSSSTATAPVVHANSHDTGHRFIASSMTTASGFRRLGQNSPVYFAGVSNARVARKVFFSPWTTSTCDTTPLVCAASWSMARRLRRPASESFYLAEVILPASLPPPPPLSLFQNRHRSPERTDRTWKLPRLVNKKTNSHSLQSEGEGGGDKGHINIAKPGAQCRVPVPSPQLTWQLITLIAPRLVCVPRQMDIPWYARPRVGCCRQCGCSRRRRGRNISPESRLRYPQRGPSRPPGQFMRRT